MTEQELKPCPFCGNVMINRLDEIGLVAWCQECHAEGPMMDNWDACWNSRPIEDALRAELAAKDAEIARLNKALDQANVWVRSVDSILWAASQPMGDAQNMPELYAEMETRRIALQLASSKLAPKMSH